MFTSGSRPSNEHPQRCSETRRIHATSTRRQVAQHGQPAPNLREPGGDGAARYQCATYPIASRVRRLSAAAQSRSSGQQHELSIHRLSPHAARAALARTAPPEAPRPSSPRDMGFRAARKAERVPLPALPIILGKQLTAKRHKSQLPRGRKGLREGWSPAPGTYALRKGTCPIGPNDGLLLLFSHCSLLWTTMEASERRIQPREKSVPGSLAPNHHQPIQIRSLLEVSAPRYP